MTTNVSDIWTAALEPPTSIPDAADVVIIGGGIVGVSAAWFLARRGVSVALCEKGLIAGEQSSRNWGWVRTMMRDEREVPMMLESMRIWETLKADTGEDVGFERKGCLLVAPDSDYLDALASWMPIADEFGVDTRMVERHELDAVVANGSKHWIGGIYTPSDGRAEPHKAAPAIARAAERAGATLMTSCAVRGIETEAGRVSAVVTEHGSIRTSTVLCAAGAWSSLFCKSLGISLPQLKVKGTVARLAPGPDVLNGNVYTPKLGIRKRQDGGYTVAHGFSLEHSLVPSTLRYCLKFLPALRIEFEKLQLRIGKDFFDELFTPTRWELDVESPFEKQRILNPEPNKKELAKARAEIDALFPELAKTEFAESWGGMVETTPDVVPVMCEAEQQPGFFIATGYSGHGFGLGPGAGKAAADMLMNADGALDLHELRLGRFFDGSPITPLSSV